jgi:methylmalonyl-CoA mutase cobalamin-binding subunit
VATEYAVFGAVERRYRTGVSLLPIPITEKVQVPTREGIGDARLVAGRAAEESRGLDGFIDWSVVEAQRDVLVENGRRFFENALRLLEDCGVDLHDPLRVFLALRRIGPGTLEVLCHPGKRDDSMPKGLVPFVPTELLIMTEEFIGTELEQIRSQGIDSVVKGRRFVVASADTHWFGSYTVKSVLRQLGAEVVDIGADQDPEQVVAAAEREGWPAICVSMHNGQCLAYGQRIAALLEGSGTQCTVCFGGKLNGILEGDTEPSDMSQRLRDLGILPCATVAELVEQIEAGH